MGNKAKITLAVWEWVVVISTFGVLLISFIDFWDIIKNIAVNLDNVPKIGDLLITFAGLAWFLIFAIKNYQKQYTLTSVALVLVWLIFVSGICLSIFWIAQKFNLWSYLFGSYPSNEIENVSTISSLNNTSVTRFYDSRIRMIKFYRKLYLYCGRDYINDYAHAANRSSLKPVRTSIATF